MSTGWAWPWSWGPRTMRRSHLDIVGLRHEFFFLPCPPNAPAFPSSQQKTQSVCCDCSAAGRGGGKCGAHPGDVRARTSEGGSCERAGKKKTALVVTININKKGKKSDSASSTQFLSTVSVVVVNHHRKKKSHSLPASHSPPTHQNRRNGFRGWRHRVYTRGGGRVQGHVLSGWCLGMGGRANCV